MTRHNGKFSPCKEVYSLARASRVSRFIPVFDRWEGVEKLFDEPDTSGGVAAVGGLS